VSPARAIPVRIQNPAYLADHRAEGRSVLPAVEALQLLARVAAEAEPGLDVGASRAARFLRFLETPADRSPVEAEVQLERLEGGALVARLVTRQAAGRAGLARARTHVEVTFAPGGGTSPVAIPPLDELACLPGPGCSFPAERLYADLVPFGPSFHNAQGTVWLSEAGALGRLVAADHPAPPGPLGSPFPLDAAFHLACAWGQRYAATLAFPTGYAERRVLEPIRPGEQVSCRVFPTGREGEKLLFDLWLFDDGGAPREACLGLGMQDVSRGRMQAAGWVQVRAGEPLAALRAGCRELVVLELDAVCPAVTRALTLVERTRLEGQGLRRRRSFLGARLALKLLGRRLTGDRASPPAALETSAPDGVLPAAPGFAGPVSAAHDDRFAVAAADGRRLGVDVERMAPRVLSTRRMYLDEAEAALVAASPLGELPAATRAWCAKEAAAKACGFGLGGALARVRVTALGAERVALRIAEPALECEARVAELDGHVFALLVLGEEIPWPAT